MPKTIQELEEEAVTLENLIRERKLAELESPLPPVWMPSAKHWDAMNEAENRVLLRLVELAPFYQRDFTQPDDKWCPYYSFTSGALALQSCKSAISAPVTWHWPRPVWQLVIKEMREDVIRMLGACYHGE